ncbi:MAG: AbrB family transcriptional regulator [Pyramidobacter sp.]|nr:AbrB family transcriptional regulator [Pyramidobacter sp.]
MYSDFFLKLGGSALLFAVGYLGYFAAKRMRWPAPALLGSMAVLGAVNLFGAKIPCFGTAISFTSKVLSGVVLGEKIDRSSVALMRKMLRPILIASTWMVAASLLTGVLLYWTAQGKASLMTSLASSGAAGIAEMSIFALSVNADVGMVAFFQSIRIIVAYATLPLVAGWLARRSGQQAADNSVGKTAQKQEKQTHWEILRFAAVACLTAELFKLIHFPSPYMLGAMVGSAAVNLATGKVTSCPPKLKTFAQIGIGIMICVYLSPDTLRLIASLILPLVLTTAFLQALSFVLAKVIHDMTHWDIVTCVLATCPGGVSQVIFLAEDLNADALVAGVFHTVRMISVIVCIPIAAQIISLF